MPIPKPRKKERSKKFIARCMKDKNMKKYPNKQRLGICFTSLRKKRRITEFAPGIVESAKRQMGRK